MVEMFISSTGLISPVGLSAASACAAMRAGIDGFAELDYADNSGEPVIGAPVPGTDPDLSRRDRLLSLLERSVADCIEQVDPKELEGIPIIICLADKDRPGGSGTFAKGIASELEGRLGLTFCRERSIVLASGRTAAFEALAGVRKLFQQQQATACLIAGVDSYINAASLHWLNQHWRLKTRENSDGVIPGEAAAAVLVVAQPGGRNAVGISGLGFGTESATVMNDEPLLGLGLTEATRKALGEAGLEMHEIDFRLSDVTGESYGFREQALVVGRLLRVHQEEGYPLWHAAEYLGDTGAVAGIVQMVLARNALIHGYAPGRTALCFASGDAVARAVALISAISNGSGGQIQ